MALQRARRAAACASHLSYPWSVRGHEHRLDGGRLDAVSAQEGCGRRVPLDAEGHSDDGRADILYAATGGCAADTRSDQTYAPVRVGLGAAFGGDPPGLEREDRPRDPGTLWHDGNQHEYLQSL